MNRYSKIKLGRTSNSRSMDFSDLQSFHEKYTKPIEPTSPKITHTTQEANQMKKPNTHRHDSITPDSQEEDAENHDSSNSNGERNYSLTRLSRNGSVSSSTTASKRFSLDKQSSPRKRGVQSVVKRAFSMRRSSSVSERYCRIHDQYVTSSSPLDDNDDIDDDMENDAMQTSRSVEKKKKHGYISGRLLKACKRILGL